MASVAFAAPPRLQREEKFVLSQGEAFSLPNDLSGLFGLTDGKTGYQMKALEWVDDNDKSTHYCEVGTDDKRYMVIAYKPADGSYAINWLTDANGTVMRTIYADATGKRVVPNTDHNTEFNGQVAYWDAIVPPGTGLASNASGR